MRRGFTLIELMIAAAMTAIILAAGAAAYSAAINMDTRIRQGRDAGREDRIFQEQVTDLLHAAYISDDTTDTTTCFIASDGQIGNSATATTANTVTFTIVGQRISSAAMEDDDDDFEARNQKYGALGGVQEVAIETTPVGTPTDQGGGIYLRRQQPTDGDPTQGGYETTLDKDVTDVSFEFYDGTDWITEWDTRAAEGRRIPSAVRVTYHRDGDSADHIFTVRLPNSDVTTDNPITGVAAQ